MLTFRGSHLALSNHSVSHHVTWFLSMVFFCKEEVAFFALSPMIKKNADFKIISKFVLKKLLDYNSSDDALDFYSRKVDKNTKKGFLV